MNKLDGLIEANLELAFSSFKEVGEEDASKIDNGDTERILGLIEEEKKEAGWLSGESCLVRQLSFYVKNLYFWQNNI